MSFSIQAKAALIAVPGFGKQTVTRVLDILQKQRVTIGELWRNKHFNWKESLGLTEPQWQSFQTFREEWTVTNYWQFLLEQNVAVLQPQEYPTLLQQISDLPLLLFTQGNKDCLKTPHVAVVGSRRPTRYGQWATQKIVSDLIVHDVVIVSGFMVGIDYQSHQTAVDLGGRSVGILGFGFGSMYPKHLSKAAEEFLTAGNLFVSEYPPGQPAAQGQFPARNRLVAGLSAATIVVEAQRKSGSLITARYALDYNRVIGAVPGPIDSLNSMGTNCLLKEGAVIVMNGEDIWQEIRLSSVGS